MAPDRAPQLTHTASAESTIEPSTSGRPKRRLPVVPVVMAVIVVTIVVVSLVLVGVIPGFRSGASTSSNNNDTSYSAAAGLSNSATANVTGGPWTLFQAEGFLWAGQLSWYTAIPPLCPVNDHYHFLTDLRPGVPPLQGSFRSGNASWWEFLYANESDLLSVVVVNATALPFFVVPDTDCEGWIISGSSVIGLPPPSDFVDSHQAMADAIANNSSFFGAHPTLNASMTLESFAYNVTVSPMWLITFTSCPTIFQYVGQNETSHPGVYADIEMFASNGVVWGEVYGTATCYVPISSF